MTRRKSTRTTRSEIREKKPSHSKLLKNRRKSLRWKNLVLKCWQINHRELILAKGPWAKTYRCRASSSHFSLQPRCLSWSLSLSEQAKDRSSSSNCKRKPKLWRMWSSKLTAVKSGCSIGSARSQNRRSRFRISKSYLERRLKNANHKQRRLESIKNRRCRPSSGSPRLLRSRRPAQVSTSYRIMNSRNAEI